VIPTPDNAGQPALSQSVFRTTHWTRVLLARGDSPEAKAALSELSAAYYAPVFAFIRRTVANEDTARDLTQEFFTRLLARQGLDTVEQSKGRFRSFLLGAVKHFLADSHDQAMAAKRGGGQTVLPFSNGTDTSPGLQVTDVSASSPDREFDRKWALTILDRALVALTAEHEEAGESARFNILKPWLTGENERLSHADAASALSMNEGAVKTAAHRLRRRFRELVKAEIAQTVPDPAQVDQELRHLQEVLG